MKYPILNEEVIKKQIYTLFVREEGYFGLPFVLVNNFKFKLDNLWLTNSAKVEIYAMIPKPKYLLGFYKYIRYEPVLLFEDHKWKVQPCGWVAELDNAIEALNEKYNNEESRKETEKLVAQEKKQSLLKEYFGDCK